eukprot:3876473-Rhodomonas_salina.4
MGKGRPEAWSHPSCTAPSQTACSIRRPSYLCGSVIFSLTCSALVAPHATSVLEMKKGVFMLFACLHRRCGRASLAGEGALPSESAAAFCRGCSSKLKGFAPVR